MAKGIKLYKSFLNVHFYIYSKAYLRISSLYFLRCPFWGHREDVAARNKQNSYKWEKAHTPSWQLIQCPMSVLKGTRATPEGVLAPPPATCPSQDLSNCPLGLGPGNTLIPVPYRQTGGDLQAFKISAHYFWVLILNVFFFIKMMIFSVSFWTTFIYLMAFLWQWVLPIG